MVGICSFKPFRFRIESTTPLIMLMDINPDLESPVFSTTPRPISSYCFVFAGIPHTLLVGTMLTSERGIFDSSEALIRLMTSWTSHILFSPSNSRWISI
ncbi:MAG: hypothetical protein A4E35_00388 [Methanoregula sp. PtaU1.Bin051]|nr:MAG: hypothetical protein A4E35_00388 [Methanoregula sp. PtaU1.Bin051]